MTKSITRRRTKRPTCQLCGEPLETVATADNPTAAIRANGLARCPSCMIMFLIDANLQPMEPRGPADDAPFDEAMNASPEIREWALKTLEIARIRTADEQRAECAVAREWLVARNAPDLADELATLDAYVAGFDDKGFARAPSTISFRAFDILAEMRRQTKH